MLEHAMEDRLASKKVSKQLAQTALNARTAYRQKLWANRFHGFRENTLGIDSATLPTGEQIERFLTVMATRIAGRLETTDAPCKIWLTQGLQMLIPQLVFDCPDFKSTPRDRLR